MREHRQRHRLQPHLARPGEPDEEQAVTAEDFVLDAGHRRELVLDALLDDADVRGMHAQRLPGREVVLAQLAGKLDPRVTGALELLEQEAEPAQQAAAEMAGIECGRQLRTLEPGEEAVALDQIGAARAERHLEDLPRQTRRERDRAGLRRRRVSRHEERAAAEAALRRVPHPVGAGERSRRLELDAVVEPAELARLGHDGLTRGEVHLEHGHRRPTDHGVHAAVYRPPKPSP